MVSSKDGDKRAVGGVFRNNKISPAPVFYALVHPKPQAAAKPSTPPPQQKQHPYELPPVKNPLRSPDESPFIAVGTPPNSYAEALGKSSSQQDEGPSRRLSPGFRRKNRAAMLSPLLINDLNEEISASLSANAPHHNNSTGITFLGQQPILVDGKAETQHPRSLGSSSDGRGGGGGADSRRLSNDGSVGSMVTAVATAALDAADAAPRGGVSSV